MPAPCSRARGSAGCLWEPKIEDRWTRIDLQSASVLPLQAVPVGSSITLSGRATITYRAILTGAVVAELRASSTIPSLGSVVGPDAEREPMAAAIDRILASSVSLGRHAKLVTGWDHLIQPFDFSFSGTVPATLDSAGVPIGAPVGLFLVCYLHQRIPAGVGLLTGSTQFDAELADYQWDTTPRAGWGLSGLVGRGRFAAGLELWRTGTSQGIGDLGAAPEVHATSLELVGEARIAGRWGTDLWVRGHGGRLRLGYQPDRITIQPPGPVSPIEVELAPVGAWIGGAGAALRRPVASRWTVGLGIDTRVFTIDTAHRSGDAVVYARQSFGDWSARCEIARMFGRR